MTVYVIMHNDYPDAVYALEALAKAHVLKHHNPSAGTFVRIYPFEILDTVKP